MASRDVFGLPTWPWTRPGTEPGACVYEWHPRPQGSLIIPASDKTSYKYFFSDLLRHGVNSSKNQFRSDVDHCVRNATQRQLWELRVKTPERTVRVPSMAHPHVASRYLKCMRNQRVAFVGDSYPLQTWIALARGLQSSGHDWRWVHHGTSQVDFELTGDASDAGEAPQLYFPEFGSTLQFHRVNVFLKRENTDGGKRFLPRKSFAHALKSVCPDVLVLQTGNWFGISREWPSSGPTLLAYQQVVEHTMQTVNGVCPRTRVIWMPPSITHGGTDEALIVDRGGSITGKSRHCHHVDKLVNASTFQRMLQLSDRFHLRSGRLRSRPGLSPVRAEVHRRDLLLARNGTLEVLDVTLAGQARAESHFSGEDNCGHWCLPGPPDTFASLLTEQLCADGELPDPRTCFAA